MAILRAPWWSFNLFAKIIVTNTVYCYCFRSNSGVIGRVVLLSVLSAGGVECGGKTAYFLTLVSRTSIYSRVYVTLNFPLLEE